MTSPSIAVRYDFRYRPYTYVDLDREGKIITKRRWTLALRYLAENTGENILQKIFYSAIRTLGCSCRYKQVTRDVTLDLPEKNGLHAVNEYLREHFAPWQRLRCQVKHSEVIETDPSIATLDDRLKEKVLMAISEKGISPLDSKVIDCLLQARSQAMRAHHLRKDEVVAVSSKSSFLANINREIVRNEDRLDSRGSVRVYPDGSSSLCIPHWKLIEGGFKRVYREVWISPDATEVAVVRRYKLRHTHRITGTDFYNRVYDAAKPLDSPDLLIPSLYYSHPKKGPECLVEDCETDLFEVLCKFHQRRGQEEVLDNPLFQDSIESQLSESIKWMEDITRGMQYMHQRNLLHTDCKPENVMITSDSRRRCKLGDLDLMITIEKGLSRIRTPHGTAEYVKPGATGRDMSTELYALGQVFSYEHPKILKPSFMMMIAAMEKRAAFLGSASLREAVSEFKKGISLLANEMKEGFNRSEKIVDYDYVLAKLAEIKRIFEIRTSTSAAAGAGAGVSGMG